MKLEDLKPIFEDVLDVDLDDFCYDSHLYDDLGLDSLGAIAVAVEVQRSSGVKLSEENLSTVTTMREMSRMLSKLNEV